MRYRATLLCCALLLTTAVAAQPVPNLTTQNPAMNAPDQLAWQLFIQINTAAGGSNATFETWARDGDTFALAPKFPSAPVRISPHPPIVPTIGREILRKKTGFAPLLAPGGGARGEETRRNKAAFDFIVQNNLYKVSGLRAAYAKGKPLVFPVDAIEVKANWVKVADIPKFTLNRISPGDVPKFFHVNTDVDGTQWALVAMHVITKLVPNWTWATFEHEMNPGRCDIIGCRDMFGAQQSLLLPNDRDGEGYPACAKTPALNELLASAKWDPAFVHYCLKGTQTDFTDPTGLANRLGNSITEDGFVATASCMTCHARAAFDSSGQATSPAGFFPTDAPIAPLGAIDPTWYWAINRTVVNGARGPEAADIGVPPRIAMAADLVWSIPFCALDDTTTPPRTQSLCRAK